MNAYAADARTSRRVVRREEGRADAPSIDISHIFAVILAGFAAFAWAQFGGVRSTALSTQDDIDIQQLYALYAVLIDTGDADGWANTFTPDGVFNNSSQGHDPLVQFVHDWRDKRRGARRAVQSTCSCSTSVSRSPRQHRVTATRMPS